MAIVIDHERYGGPCTFDDLRDAEDTIRDCGGDWANTTLKMTADGVIDDRGEVVGYEK